MIRITIDGKTFTAKDGETILEVARRNQINIPTLCYASWAEPQGGCRLCSVEFTKPSWDGWCKVVTACNHPVQKDMIVYTRSERIVNIRKNIIDLLLARCPNTPEIQKIAEEYGITKTSFIPREDPDDCILCGLCVKACEKIGAYAISTVGRGTEKEVCTPFRVESNDCVGCACCAQVCPTNFIKYEEERGVRKIWGSEFTMLACKECGKTWLTEAQVEHFLKNNDNVQRDYFEKCDACHRKETVKTFTQIVV